MGILQCVVGKALRDTLRMRQGLRTKLRVISSRLAPPNVWSSAAMVTVCQLTTYRTGYPLVC